MTSMSQINMLLRISYLIHNLYFSCFLLNKLNYCVRSYYYVPNLFDLLSFYFRLVSPSHLAFWESSIYFWNISCIFSNFIFFLLLSLRVSFVHLFGVILSHLSYAHCGGYIWLWFLCTSIMAKHVKCSLLHIFLNFSCTTNFLLRWK